MTIKATRLLISPRISTGLMCLAILMVAGVSRGFTADYQWVGPTGADWSESANWSPAGVPNQTGDNVLINTAGLISLTNVPNTAFTVGNITNAQNVTTSSTIGQNNTTDDILTLAVTSGSPTINVTNVNQALFLYCTIAGNQGLTKAGAGRATFRFNGVSNTLSGPINIVGGVLGIEKDESLGDPANAINIANGARLTAEPGNGGNTFSLAPSRLVTLTGAAQVGVSGASVNFSMPNVTGTGDLRKTDAGTLVLNGVATYSGETRVLGGGMTVNTTSGEFNQQKFLILQAQANGFLDYSALTNFTFSNGTAAFQVVPNTSSGVGVINQLNLARSGDFGGLNTITANSMQIGGGSATAGSLHEAQLHLGTTNYLNLNTNGMLIGGFRATGLIDFQGGLTSPYLKIRSTNGTSRMAGTFKVGETSSGSISGAGNLNLTGGTVDASVSELIISRHVSNATNPDNSRMTMDDGLLDVLTLIFCQKTNNGAGGMWPTLTGTFNQNGGTVKAQTILMAQEATGTNYPVVKPTYNLNKGTLYAAVITNGTGGYNTDPGTTRNINWQTGIIRNYDATTDLVIDGGAGSGDRVRINLNAGGSGDAPAFYADAGRTITLGEGSRLNDYFDGANVWVTDITNAGPGTLVINSSNEWTGTLRVDAGTLAGSGVLNGPVVVAPIAKLAPGTSAGTLTVNNELTLGGTTIMELDFNNGISTNYDRVVGLTTVKYGGALILTNIGGVIPVNTSFKLFDAQVYENSFTSVVPPAGYTIQNDLATDGSITILTAPVTSPELIFEREGSDLIFTWTPATGFQLQAQTNTLNTGLSSTWHDYPGGGTPPVVVPASPSNPSVFFRLKSMP